MTIPDSPEPPPLSEPALVTIPLTSAPPAEPTKKGAKVYLKEQAEATAIIAFDELSTLPPERIGRDERKHHKPTK